MKTALARVLLVAACCSGYALTSAARAEDAWRAEFDRTCADTTEAMGLSEGELAALTARCDKLEKAIESLGETERKVFLKRLQMCRNLYQFVLETKRNERAGK